jgi:hypothetical protein
MKLYSRQIPGPIMFQKMVMSPVSKKNSVNVIKDNVMSQKSLPSSVETRKGAPLWVQILVWIGLSALLILLGVGLLRAQINPIR